MSAAAAAAAVEEQPGLATTADPVGCHLRWLRQQGRSPRTTAERRSVLERLAAALPGPVLSADEDVISAWRESLLASPDGVRHQVTHVRQFYAWAADQGLITASPVPTRARRAPDLAPAAADTAAVGRHLAWMTGQGLAAGTIRQRRMVLRFLRAALGVSLLEADKPMLLAWRDSLPFTADGLRHYLTHARQFYAWAADQGLVGANPLEYSYTPGAADVAVISQHLDWLRLRGLSERTIRARRRALARLRAGLPVPLLDASTAALTDWRASLRLSPWSITCYVSHARQFYRWARTTGLIAADPAEAIPVPRRQLRLPRPIGEPELMTALDGAPARIRPWLVLAAWAGLRAQEIARLRREDIHDRHNPPVLIVTSYAAKGGRERIVPLCPFALAELAAARLPTRGWAFPRSDGKPGPNDPSRISHLANEYLHEAGIADTLHQLRHRFASQLYQRSGHDLRLTQDLLGHADPASTAGYAAWDRTGAPEAVGALPVPEALDGHRRGTAAVGTGPQAAYRADQLAAGTVWR